MRKKNKFERTDFGLYDYKIALIPGDGIGPEVLDAAVAVLDRVGEIFGHRFIYTEGDAGGVAIDKHGEPLPAETLNVCRQSDAVLLGAVGGRKWDNLSKRPEQALLGLRKELGLFANLRPAVLHKALVDACPLRPEIAGRGIDIMVVRELTGGMYFGETGRKVTENGQAAFDTEMYSETEIRRIARMAFDIARKRRKSVTSVDKANVLESSRLWREVVITVAKNYPDVQLSHMYVDNAAMQLIRDPAQFDVLLTTNMFGDILSDEASQLVGSIGILPSASLGEAPPGLYEPIHGSAPDIANQDKANPIAMIFSAAMMLKYSFSLEKEADAIEKSVTDALSKYRTTDIMSEGKKQIGTKEMVKRIIELI